MSVCRHIYMSCLKFCVCVVSRKPLLPYRNNVRIIAVSLACHSTKLHLLFIVGVAVFFENITSKFRDCFVLWVLVRILTDGHPWKHFDELFKAEVDAHGRYSGHPFNVHPSTLTCTHFARQIMQEYCISKKLQKIYSSPNVKR